MITKTQIESGLTQLMAKKTGVAGNALATINLDFENGVSLANFIPLFYIFKYNSGTLGIAVARMDNGGNSVNTLPLLNLDSTHEIIQFNNGTGTVVPNSGNISVTLTTAGLAASTFDVYA